MGVNCETCVDLFYRDPAKSLNDSDVCVACMCDLSGVENGGLCDKSNGQCSCKQNVEGRTCNQCMQG